jgi:SAM-dependent methyltransferase
VCGSEQRSLLHDRLDDRLFGALPGPWRLVGCGSCGCAYLDPRPTRESIGRAYEGYVWPTAPPASDPSLSGFRHKVRNGYLDRRYGYAFEPHSDLAGLLLWLFPKRRWNADLTVRHLRRPGPAPKLLDVGFGRGDFLLAMRESGWEPHGIEPDAADVAAARAHGLPVEQGAVEDAPYPDDTFDAVTLSHVVEHLHDPVASLTECLRMLKPGGVIWIATPNVASLAHRRFGRDWFGLDPPRHLVIFTRHGLDLALRRAGFEQPSFRSTYRGQLLVAASQALADGGEPLTALRPRSRQGRLLGRALDTAAALRMDWGEELIALARKPA